MTVNDTMHVPESNIAATALKSVAEKLYSESYNNN